MSSSNRIQNHRKKAFERQGGCCHYCGVRMWLVTPDELPVGRRSEAAVAKLRCTAEHLVAQCDGGTNAASNIVAACARCNHTRHRLHKPPEPPAYRRIVAKQVAQSGWHDQWVYGLGLLTRRSAAIQG